MVVSTRTGKKGQYTDALLKRLGMGQPLTEYQRKKIKQDREEFITALRSVGERQSHCRCCCCQCHGSSIGRDTPFLGNELYC